MNTLPLLNTRMNRQQLSRVIIRHFFRRFFFSTIPDRLSSLINNRPVGILLPGPSINEYFSRKAEFDELDWCWGSMNKFWLIEEKTKLDFAIFSCPDDTKRFEAEINKFRGLLITDQRQFKNRYYYRCQGHIYMNTLFSLLLLLIEKRARKIILFGADGATINGAHYFSKEYSAADYAEDILPLQTEYLNSFFPNYPGEIINCSINSDYHRFPKISYDQLLENQAR